MRVDTAAGPGGPPLLFDKELQVCDNQAICELLHNFLILLFQSFGPQFARVPTKENVTCAIKIVRIQESPDGAS